MYVRNDIGSLEHPQGFGGVTQGFGGVTPPAQQIDGMIALLRLAQTSSKQGRVRQLHQVAGIAKVLARELHSEGDTVAARNLETIDVETFQEAGYSNPQIHARWFRLLTAAKSSIRAVASMTPARSRALADPIMRRLATLGTRIRQLQRTIGGRGDITGVFNPLSTAETAREFASISKLIRRTEMLPVDKERLQVRKREILKQHGKLTDKAREEGMDISDALDALSEGCAFYDIPCLWETEKKKMIMGGVAIVGVLAVVIAFYGFVSGVGKGLVGSVLRK